MISAPEIDTLFAAVQTGCPREVLEKLAPESDLPLPARVLLGIAALEAGDPGRSARELESVLQDQPDNPPAPPVAGGQRVRRLGGRPCRVVVR